MIRARSLRKIYRDGTQALQDVSLDLPIGVTGLLGSNGAGKTTLMQILRYGNTPMVPIEEGQCFTIEPRLTVEGHGIATCEDIVAVTAGGSFYLSKPQEALWLVHGWPERA